MSELHELPVGCHVRGNNVRIACSSSSFRVPEQKCQNYMSFLQGVEVGM